MLTANGDWLGHRVLNGGGHAASALEQLDHFVGRLVVVEHLEDMVGLGAQSVEDIGDLERASEVLNRMVLEERRRDETEGRGPVDVASCASGCG